VIRLFRNQRTSFQPEPTSRATSRRAAGMVPACRRNGDLLRRAASGHRAGSDPRDGQVAAVPLAHTATRDRCRDRGLAGKRGRHDAATFRSATELAATIRGKEISSRFPPSRRVNRPS
jgi:hypothetical protein